MKFSQKTLFKIFTVWNADQLQLPSEKPIFTQCPLDRIYSYNDMSA